MALTDFAYGTTRLVSDANMGSGPSLASNLLNNEGTAVFYRSTSWSRNRVTNGRYTVVERAGYKIGFFVLNDPAQAAVISASNGSSSRPTTGTTPPPSRSPPCRTPGAMPSLRLPPPPRRATGRRPC